MACCRCSWSRALARPPPRAVIPAALAIVILVFAIKEQVPKKFSPRPLLLRRSEFALFTDAFWWAIAVASLLSLARFSYAFLILKAHSIGIDAAFVPIMLVLMHVVYAVAAYPFGVLADRIDRRLQLGIGAAILIGADIVAREPNRHRGQHGKVGTFPA
jgi:hypothetical protein